MLQKSPRRGTAPKQEPRFEKLKMASAPTMPEELMEKISQNPRFKEVKKPGQGFTIGAVRAPSISVDAEPSRVLDPLRTAPQHRLRGGGVSVSFAGAVPF